METITPALPEHVQRRIARDVNRRIEGVARFATKDAAIAPLTLIAPLYRRDWLELTPAERIVAIRAKLTEQITARHIMRHARKLAEAEAPAPVETTPASAPAPGPRYVVACIAGCGTFHPASSGRPVIVACGASTEPRNKQSEPSAFEVGTAELSARLRREAKAAATPSPTPRKTGKAPKKRRRATCSNSR